MSIRNLCLFTVLAAIAAFPSLRKLEREIRQAAATRTNSPTVDAPPAIFLPVQSKKTTDLGPGKLLVASRELADPNFAETVILLVHYDTEGVVGLMLNRRTHIPISRVFSQIKAAKRRSDPVYLGGPVETPTVFALLQSTHKLEKAEHVFGGVYWISSKTALEKAISSRADPGHLHIYLGYAGWSADQLKSEVRLGGWFIFPAEQQTVFNAHPESLWREMIKKTELNVAGCPATASPERKPTDRWRPSILQSVAENRY